MSNDNDEFDYVKGALGGAAAIGAAAIGVVCYQQVIINQQQEKIEQQQEEITDLEIDNAICKDDINDAKRVLE